MTRALLIVDVQNDFCEGGALGVDGGNAVAARVTAHMRAAQTGQQPYALIAASRDWHEADSDNGGHFAAPGADPNFVDTWPVHCVQGSEGAEYHPAVDVSLIDVHLRKGTGEPAYSAFEGITTDGNKLASLLTQAGVTSLDVVGIATDHCVRASVLDALAAGFEVRVLTDLIAGVAPEPSVAALKEMAAAGAVIQPAG